MAGERSGRARTDLHTLHHAFQAVSLDNGSQSDGRLGSVRQRRDTRHGRNRRRFCLNDDHWECTICTNGICCQCEEQFDESPPDRSRRSSSLASHGDFVMPRTPTSPLSRQHSQLMSRRARSATNFETISDSVLPDMHTLSEQAVVLGANETTSLKRSASESVRFEKQKQGRRPRGSSNLKAREKGLFMIGYSSGESSDDDEMAKESPNSRPKMQLKNLAGREPSGFEQQFKFKDPFSKTTGEGSQNDFESGIDPLDSIDEV